MKQQKVKLIAVVFAVWSIFCGPIIAQSITEITAKRLWKLELHRMR